MIQLSCWEMTIRVPPKPKSMLLVVPKVQRLMRVFSIAQRMPSTRQLRLLPAPMGGTILMTSPRRLRACSLPIKELRCQIPYIPPLRASRASHCTAASVLCTSIRAAPDLRPHHPVTLVPEARLHAALERHQRTSSVKRVIFIPVEA
jgi:hypothetical protein